WEFAGWYGGGCYPNITFDPNVKNRVYLTSDVAGIWRSDNAGDEWSFITEGLKNLNVAQVVVAKANSNVLYAATEKGLFYSLNGGGHWEKSDDVSGAISFQRPQSYRAVAVSASHPEKLCVGTTKGKIFCSGNYGRNWSMLQTGFQKLESISALSFTSAENDLIVANKSGLFKYNFSDRTWGPLLRNSYAATDFVI